MKFKILSIFAFLAFAFAFTSQVEAKSHRHHHCHDCRSHRKPRVNFFVGAGPVAPAVVTTTYVQPAPVVYPQPYGYTYTHYYPAPVQRVAYVQPVQPVPVYQPPVTYYKIKGFNMQVQPNNYLVTAYDSTNKFETNLDRQLKSFRNKRSQISWWSPKKKNLHCTVAYLSAGNQNVVDQKIINLFSKAVAHEPYSKKTSVVGYDIATNGTVFLTLSHNKSLMKVHNHIIDDFSQNGLIPSIYSKQSYVAHISIGKLIPNADPIKARKELDNLLSKVKSAHQLFIIDKLELKKTNQTLKNVHSLKTINLH